MADLIELRMLEGGVDAGELEDLAEGLGAILTKVVVLDHEDERQRELVHRQSIKC